MDMQLHVSSPVGRAAIASACFCSLLYIMIGQEVQYPHRVAEVDGRSPLNVTETLYITRQPKLAAPKMESIRLKTGFSNIGVHVGIGEKEVNLTSLPLYTRYVLETGRHDIYQVGSPAMVGKYFSHVSAWRRMQEGDVFAVFEEDAHFSDTTRHQLVLLDRYVEREGLSFEMIMLGLDRSPEPSGELKTHDVGEGLKLIQCQSACMLRGTRGYVITYEGARKILKYTEPVEIQIDGLVSLMARYYKDFKLFWTSTDLALGPSVLEQLNDAVGQNRCFKCHFPTSNVYYIGFWVLLAVFWIALCCCRECTCCCRDLSAYIKESSVVQSIQSRASNILSRPAPAQSSSSSSLESCSTPFLALRAEGEFEVIKEEEEVQGA